MDREPYLLFPLICFKRGIALMSSYSGANRFFNDFKRFTPLLKNLVTKDIKIKYRRSVLGIAWSILNPMLTMIVLTQVFKMLLKIEVDNFATYYIVGSAMWGFFSEATTISLDAILGSASLIKKVYIPKYIFPLEKCLYSLVNFMFSLIAVLIVMLFQGVYPTFTTLLFPIPVLYCFLFTCGMCLLLSAITVYFRDIAHLYSVFLTMWIYLTPIIYPIQIIENQLAAKPDDTFIKIVHTVIQWNPMTHFVQYFRDVVMYNTVPGLSENLSCLAISCFVFFVGCFVFKKAEGKFILHI